MGGDGGSGGSGDGSMAGKPNPVCYGPADGPWRVCLAAAPPNPITLPAEIDTDKSILCERDQPAGWMPAQPAACFILGMTIMTSAMPVLTPTRVTGQRPLVLLADTTISIATLVDVASHRTDNNDRMVASPKASCRPFSQAPGAGDGNGGGGGAGGSFTTRGGNGGRGGSDNENGQAALADPAAPTALRGGCPGQVGGDRSDADAGAGRGGGAIYLLAGGAITIAGVVNASGAGGSGGARRTGGSGGGSGGMIILHGASISIGSAGTVLANGGGGAGGGLQSADGIDAQDPEVLTPMNAAKGGGNGGNGFPAVDNELDGTGGATDNDGGGGGGGGAGYIRANHPLGSPTRVSPAAIVVMDPA